MQVFIVKSTTNGGRLYDIVDGGLIRFCRFTIQRDADRLVKELHSLRKDLKVFRIDLKVLEAKEAELNSVRKLRAKDNLMRDQEVSDSIVIRPRTEVKHKKHRTPRTEAYLRVLETLASEK